MPIWSGVIISPKLGLFNIRKSRITYNPVENWFGKLKHGLFKNFNGGFYNSNYLLFGNIIKQSEELLEKVQSLDFIQSFVINENSDSDTEMESQSEQNSDTDQISENNSVDSFDLIDELNTEENGSSDFSEIEKEITNTE
ncbi:unnamed protein product, partial [Brachionus calyciflorus]